MSKDFSTQVKRSFDVPTVVNKPDVVANVVAAYQLLGNALLTLVPNGREKSICYTRLEESMLWAITGVMRE